MCIRDSFQGDRQNVAAQAGLDGYQQSQRAVARGAQLVVGTYTPYYNKATGAMQYALGRSEDTVRQVVLSDRVAAIAAGLELGGALPADRNGVLLLDTTRLNGFGLGAVRIAAEDIAAQSDLTVAPGGDITLFASRVSVDGTLSARSGSIRLGNVLSQVTPSGPNDTSIGATPSDRLTLGARGRLDTSGLWSNLALAPGMTGAMPYLNGGSVSLRGSGDILLERGSVIHVGSGAALRAKGKLTGGKGGNVTIETVMSGTTTGRLDLGAELRGYGVEGGGTLSLTAGKVVLGAMPADVGADVLALAEPFFQRGFARYEIIGSRGVAVADGARIDVAMPVYRPAPEAGGAPTGADSAAVLQAWLPPVYLPVSYTHLAGLAAGGAACGTGVAVAWALAVRGVAASAASNSRQARRGEGLYVRMRAPLKRPGGLGPPCHQYRDG